MKDLYYIGEAAEILNVSTQTLRYYDKIGILQPAYTDPETGYRKYTYDQVSYADRIRHLQSMGLNLDEIQDALSGNDTQKLQEILRAKREKTAGEIERLNALLKNIDWYCDYYSHVESTGGMLPLPFTTRLGERYVLVESATEDDGAYGIGHRLMRRKNSRGYSNLTYLRQNGYLMNTEKLLAGEFAPSHYFVLLGEKPPFENKHIVTLPAGIYLCLRTRILSEPLPIEQLRPYFPAFADPPVFVAMEYENNFVDFQNCPYEIQILLRPAQSESKQK